MTGALALCSPTPALAAILFLTTAAPARAQVRGLYTPGMTATNSAVLPDAGLTYVQLFQWYSFDELKGRNGETLPVNATVSLLADQNLFIAVTPHRVLGATYAFAVDVPVVGSSVTTPTFGAIAGGASIGDTYVMPLMLGWHLKRADFEATYGFTIPTGRFNVGASDNTGAGYWGHIPTFAETVYLTANKATTFSAFQAYEFHTTQKDTSIRAGQTFDLDYSLMQLVPLGEDKHTLLQIGLAGYGQYETTDRSGPAVDPVIAANTHYRVNAIGLAANVLVPARKTSVGLKWFKEFSNRATVEGGSLQISVAISF